MDKLPVDLIVCIAEQLRERPDILIECMQPVLSSAQNIICRPLDGFDVRMCLQWNGKDPRNWDVVIRSLFNLLNFSLTSHRYYTAARSVLDKVLSRILKCVRCPPWQNFAAYFSKGLQRCVLEFYFTDLIKLPSKFRRWAVRVTAPALPYREASKTRVLSTPTAWAYMKWSRTLNLQSYQLPRLGLEGEFVNSIPHDHQASCDWIEGLPHSYEPDGKSDHEPAGLFCMLKSLNRDVIKLKYHEENDDYEINTRQVLKALTPQERQRISEAEEQEKMDYCWRTEIEDEEGARASRKRQLIEDLGALRRKMEQKYPRSQHISS